MTFPGFIWRSGMRNKRRTIFTVLSVALTFFVFSTLITFINELDRRLAEINASRLVTRNAVIWIYPIPLRDQQQIAKVPGVVATTPLTFYGGIYKDRANTDFAQFSTDPKSFFEVFPEIQLPADQQEAFKRERVAAIVGRQKAEKHGWKIGDHIKFQGAVIPVDLELVVRGIFSGSVNDESNVYFHHDYLDEAAVQQRGATSGIGGVLTFYSRVESPESVSRVAQDIDALFADTDKATRTETEKAFQTGFVSLLGNIKYLIAVISSLIIFTILLVTANTMAMSVRERTREIAIQKALGFRRSRVLFLMMSEGVLITVLGGLIGCFGARFIFGFVDIAGYTMGRFQELNVTWGIIAFGLLISWLLGLASTGLSAYRVTRLTVADGLRNVG